MPRFPVGNLADAVRAEEGGWTFDFFYQHQKLDRVYLGDTIAPNPENRRNTQRTILVRGEYGLTPGTSLAFGLPVRDVDLRGMETADVTGAGDLEAAVRWSPLPVTLARRVLINLSAGVTLPTGRSTGSDLTQENIQFGAGAVSALAAVEMSARLTPHAALFGRAGGRWPTGEGDDGYRFGDAYDWLAGLDAGQESGRVRLQAMLLGVHLKQDTQDGVPVEDRGGRLLYGIGGVRFETTEKTALAFSVQRLVDADLRGDQLAARWVFQDGVQVRFGGGEHPAHAD